jgi:hypothetical protein
VATIDIRHAHGTDFDDATEKGRTLIEKFAAKRSDLVKEVRWSADGASATVLGRGFQGDFKVTDSEIRIAINLKLLARPFKAQIEESLWRRVRSAFGS